MICLRALSRHSADVCRVGGGNSIVFPSYETGKSVSHTHASTHFCMEDNLKVARDSLNCH